METLERIQAEADLITALYWLMDKVEGLKIKTHTHGYPDNEQTPEHFQTLSISCCNMMDLSTCHTGDANQGRKYLIDIIRGDDDQN